MYKSHFTTSPCAPTATTLLLALSQMLSLLTTSLTWLTSLWYLTEMPIKLSLVIHGLSLANMVLTNAYITRLKTAETTI